MLSRIVEHLDGDVGQQTEEGGKDDQQPHLAAPEDVQELSLYLRLDRDGDASRAQDDGRDVVEEQRGQVGNQTETVPGAHIHEQLVGHHVDKQREGDRRVPPGVLRDARGVHHTQGNGWDVVAEDTVEEGLREVDPEYLEVEIDPPMARLKEDRVLHTHFLVNIDVEHEGEHAGPARP